MLMITLMKRRKREMKIVRMGFRICRSCRMDEYTERTTRECGAMWVLFLAFNAQMTPFEIVDNLQFFIPLFNDLYL
jgi:hypothetical protein